MIETMRNTRAASLGLIVLAASGGCSSVLGLDEFEAGAGGATSSGSTTSTGDSATTTTSTGDSSATTASTGDSSTTTTGGDGGGGASSQGGGGAAADGGGGASSQGGGGSAADGGGGAGGSDVVGPTVVVSSASVANNATTNSSRATFLFVSDPAGSAVGFECSIDGGAFEDCTNGFDRRLLPGGVRILQVRGRDSMGNFGPVLERRWTIEAIGTTILALRQHTIPDDTLVQISTNVRATITATVAGQQNVFVQDVNGGFGSAFVTALRNHAIRTMPRNSVTAEPGRALVVVGTFQTTGGSDTIVAAEYVPGALLAPYAALRLKDTEVLDDEALESVYVGLAGEVPLDFNCSGGCNLPGGAKCLEGCYDCHVLDYLDVNQSGTFEWGDYFGTLVGGNDRVLWFVESFEGGDDVCL